MKAQVLIVAMFIALAARSQVTTDAPVVKMPSELMVKFNEDGSRYVKMTALNQVWVRYTDANPGTKVYGQDQPEIFDIGIRRLRFQMYGQLTDKVFFYTQFGQNNFTYLSKLYQGSFFHDAVVELKVAGKHLSVGTGLTGWSGLSRFASPSVGSILGIDAPLYQQATNGLNDQFLRKLSIYGKGKLGKLDYRFALSKPFVVQNSTVPVNALSVHSDFSTDLPMMQSQGYVQYQFLDEESNLIPYTVGSYLGKKRVFNIGAGFIHQNAAMWHTSVDGADTLYNAMNLLGVDVIYDTPLNKEKETALTIYAAYNRYDFGPGYIRQLGVMNPAAGGSAGPGILNGPGNGFPAIGTGNIFYAQAGYLLDKNLLKEGGTLQPYIAGTYGDFERLAEPMLQANAGINWFIHGKHSSKIAIDGQMRPIFKADNMGAYRNDGYKGMYTLQYQISI